MKVVSGRWSVVGRLTQTIVLCLALLLFVSCANAQPADHTPQRSSARFLTGAEVLMGDLSPLASSRIANRIDAPCAVFVYRLQR